jgi:hypothetical protein
VSSLATPIAVGCGAFGALYWLAQGDIAVAAVVLDIFDRWLASMLQRWQKAHGCNSRNVLHTVTRLVLLLVHEHVTVTDKSLGKTTTNMRVGEFTMNTLSCPGRCSRLQRTHHIAPTI